MFNRNTYLTLLVYVAALSAAFGQNGGTAAPGSGLMFQLPGIGSTSGQFIGYLENANPLNPSISATGPAGTAQLLLKPDGSKVFMIGTSVQSIDGAFSIAPSSVNGLVGPPTAAAISPDGTLLLVGASDSNNNGYLYIINAATSQVLGSPLPLPSVPNYAPETSGFCPGCWIAFTPDSQKAFVLTNSGVGSRVTAFNLSTRQQIGQLVLTGGATSIGISPLGLLYVTAVNIITEINPATFTVTPTGSIQLFFSPGRLRFSTDGVTAYAPNLVPASGGSLLQLNLASHATQSWPPNNSGVTPPLFDDVLIAGASRIFATSSQTQTLFDVTPSPLSATPSAVTVGPGNIQLDVLAATISTEIPVSNNLFLLVANGNQTLLYRINLNTNTVSAQVLATSILTDMQFLGVPDTGVGSPASFLQYNNNQTLANGGISLPLIARVIDASGYPVFGVTTSFTTDATNGAVIANAAPVTNADGYVSTTVNVPNVGGTYTITLTAGAASTTFTLVVPGGVCSSTCTTTTSSQVTIVNGNGQLFSQDTSTQFPGYSPLTLMVTDTNGNPLAGVAVSFAFASGTISGLTPIGIIEEPTAVTDANGLASTDFFAFSVPVNQAFQTVTITGATSYGTVTFTENILHINGDSSGQPEITFIAPTQQSNFTIVAGQGTPLPNAIELSIVAANFPQIGVPIPGVGLTLVNTLNPGQPAQAQCTGNNLSDQNGIAHCTLVAACMTGNFPVTLQIGNFYNQPIDLQIVAGSASQLNIVGGNNQSGTAGQTLSQPLTATLTDGCGTPVVGGAVTWQVTKGSATLVSTVNTSDGQGRVSTKVTLGQSAGSVTITVSTAGGITAAFTVTNQVIVSSIAVVSGNAQIGGTGANFGAPVVFVVKDNNGNAIPGITVNFAVVSGSGSVNPVSATTSSTGTAQTTVTAGATPGAIVVSGSAAGFSATAVLVSQLPGPMISVSSFVNAASFQPGLAVCGLASVTGTGLAPSIQGVKSGLSAFGPLPLTLGGVSIAVNGIQAPIYSVSNENGTQQVTFQVPCELSPGSATVVVTVNGSPTTVSGVQVFIAQPGIFTFAGTNGKVYGAVQSALTGQYVTQTNFAVRGQTYYLYVTGLGQTIPPTATDNAGIPSQNVALQVVVGVNNAGAPVLSAQYEEGGIGVYVIAFQIPLNFATGPDQNLAVAVIVNGQTVFGNGVLIPGVM